MNPYRFQVVGHSLSLHKVVTGEVQEFSLSELPTDFLRWQIDTRQRLYERLESGDDVSFMPSHLPVLATLDGKTDDFPVNLATKGVALLPKPDHLARFTDLFESRLSLAKKQGQQEGLATRLSAVRSFYSAIRHLETCALGGLEIFEGRTYRQLLENPKAALLYVDHWPGFRSYQIDVVTEIVPKSDLRYRFLAAARRLFEGDRFHVLQSGYAFGYVFWVVQVHDKTPFTRVQK